MSLESLRAALEKFAAPMSLSKDEGGGRVRCLACGHRCLIPEDKAGVCKVRFNRRGMLYGPRRYVSGLQDDPIEKKPFYHALPGSRALSFGMLGCDFHCGYCQNWVSSQALRDEASRASFTPVSAEEVVVTAKEVGAMTITSTYNEPLITSEWAVEIFKLARNAGLATSFVSNGNATPEVIEFLAPWLDFYKIDLKGFDDRRYRSLGGTLRNVLESIEGVYRAGMWLEIVTLVVPDFNDSDAELKGIAGFIAEISPDIPWHVTAFHPDYRMSGGGNTKVSSLMRAYKIGKRAGLNFVYPGNIAGKTGGLENTWCPHCEQLLVERRGFALREYNLENGACPRCQAIIPGFWHSPETITRLEISQSPRIRRITP